MSTPITIIDENGDTPLIIDRGLVTTPNPIPAPSNGELMQIPFIQALSTDGSGTGIEIDLRLNGSLASPIDAFIGAVSNADIYIKTANIFIEDNATLILQDFGAIADGLTNGLNTFIESEGVKFPITKQPILTNLDLTRIGTKTPTLGSDDSAFRIKVAGQGNSNSAYNPVWDFTLLAAGTEGVILPAGTNRKLGITINDDLTGLEAFNIIMSGYLRFI